LRPFDPSTVTESMMEEIHALNRELIAAGARKFACGVSPAAQTKTVRRQADGEVRELLFYPAPEEEAGRRKSTT
jgi:hypothetical protein